MSCPKCPASQIVDPPQVVYRDIYLPQVVEVIHPIEVVNRYHCVPVPQHCYTVSVRDEFCPPAVGGVAEVSQARNAKRRRKK